MKVLKEVRGRVVELGKEAQRGWWPPGAARPKPTPSDLVIFDLAIQQGEGGFYLTWTHPDPRCCGDTWHEEFEDAMEQAEVSFGIARTEWTDPETNPSAT